MGAGGRRPDPGRPVSADGPDPGRLVSADALIRDRPDPVAPWRPALAETDRTGPRGQVLTSAA